MKTLAERLAARPPIPADRWKEGFGTARTTRGIDPETIQNVKVVGESKDAIAFTLGGDPEWQWVPRSLLFPTSVCEVGQVGALVVSAWFAEKKGWV